jgi:demethylmenaquinone methyltransferase/2-methoxy-6-polyprenyl-1,4-benzoquinol methylase
MKRAFLLVDIIDISPDFIDNSGMTFETPAEKRQYVNRMFAQIAHRYDLMNRIMTVGQDQRWRKLLIEQADLPPNGRLLDIATGTGDIAFEALRRRPDLTQVVGADFTLPMMQVGQQRWRSNDANQPGPSWSGADTLHLPFPGDTFDAVASGFLLRNVTDVALALAEQRRVCRPGGRVLALEIPRPPNNLLGQMFRLYFHRVVPLLGGLISGQKDAYAYLPASADAFLRPDELKAVMEQVGLRQVSYTMLMFHTVALHVGIK